MPEEQKSPVQIRQDVYQELLAWLRRQNAPRRWAVLDRPFVLTLMHKLEERFSAAAPLDSILLRVGVLYSCPSVRSTASQILTQWHSYVTAFQAFNRDWNVQQQLAKPQIDAAEASRKQLLAERAAKGDRLANQPTVTLK